MKANKRLRALTCMTLVGLCTGVWGAQNDFAVERLAHGNEAPISPLDASALENLIDDQGEMRLVASYPARDGVPARRTAFVHLENQTVVNDAACTIVTRVMRQGAHDRDVVLLSDVTHMEIMTMSALLTPSGGPSPTVDPDSPVVVLNTRGGSEKSIFMFRSIEPARRFLAILQRVVPRCGGRDD